MVLVNKSKEKILIMISLAVYVHSDPYGLLHRKLYSIIISDLLNLGSLGFASQKLSLQSKIISVKQLDINSQVAYIRTPFFLYWFAHT